MNVSINKESEYILKINTQLQQDESFSDRINLYYSILEPELLGKNISVITLKPQPYSLGHELGGSCEIKKVSGQKFLFNWLKDCKKQTVLDVIESEEFRRGLLFVIEGIENDLETIAADIIKYYQDAVSVRFRTHAPTLFCEIDGSSLCLYNSNWGVQSLQKLIEDLNNIV